MKLEHTFSVPADLATVWQAVLDPQRVAPCMPGATLTEVNGSSFSGTVKVKLGPISLLYKGSGEFLETDEQAHRLVIKAAGKDSKGNGTAAATVTVTLSPEGETTTGSVHTELTITGKPAQFGRGMISEVGGKILDTFANCLATNLAPSPEPSPQPSATAPGSSTQPPTTAPDSSTSSSTAPSDLGTTTPHQDRPSVPAGRMDVGSPPGSGGGFLPEGAEKSAGGRGTGAAGTAEVGEAAERPRLAVVEEGGPRSTSNGIRRESVAEPETEPIDLLSYAGPSVLKRAVPLIFVVIVVLLIVARRRRSR